MIQELRMQIIILIFFMAISMKEYGFKKMRKMSGDYKLRGGRPNLLGRRFSPPADF